MVKCLAISSFSFALLSGTKGGSRGWGGEYPPHKTFTSSDLCRVEGCCFALPQKQKGWQIDLPRFQNKTSRQMVMSLSFIEIGAPGRSLIWNQVFGKGNQLFILSLKTW